MLEFNLSGRNGSRHCSGGSNNAIYAVSSSLRTDHRSEDLAVYQGGLWHSVSSAETYHRVSIEQPCTIRFQQFDGLAEESTRIGPLSGVVIANGVIKTIGNRPRIIALFDDSLEQWRVFDEDTVWPIVAIEEAGSSSTSNSTTSAA